MGKSKPTHLQNICHLTYQSSEEVRVIDLRKLQNINFQKAQKG